MRRWVCPGCGSGTNAPERMRTNDVRRYCLACSAETGLLVERASPALERRREVARLRSAEKSRASREAERRRYAPTLRNALGEDVVVDLRAETRRALRAMGFRRPDRVRIEVRRRRDGQTSGHAKPWANRIVYSINGYAEDVLILVYHEAAHIATGYDPTDAYHWHGEEFQRTFAEAVQKRWPFLRYGGVRGTSSYAAGASLRAQLHAHVKNGGDL